MSDKDGGMHEPREHLTTRTQEMHRAIASLMEELEAVDWYQQRVDATSDEHLRGILAHNRDEEIEHAAMVLEWLRRNSETFDRMLRKFLFSDAPRIDELEDEEDETAAGSTAADGSLGLADLLRKGV
jgi:ferritin-like protein